MTISQPKSSLIGLAAAAVGLVAGPAAFLPYVSSMPWLRQLCFAVFVAACAVGFVALLYYQVRLISGSYQALERRNWHDQVW